MHKRVYKLYLWTSSRSWCCRPTMYVCPYTHRVTGATLRRSTTEAPIVTTKSIAQLQVGIQMPTRTAFCHTCITGLALHPATATNTTRKSIVLVTHIKDCRLVDNNTVHPGHLHSAYMYIKTLLIVTFWQCGLAELGMA